MNTTSFTVITKGAGSTVGVVVGAIVVVVGTVVVVTGNVVVVVVVVVVAAALIASRLSTVWVGGWTIGRIGAACQTPAMPR